MASLPASVPANEQANPSDHIPVPQKIGYGLGSFMDMWGQWLYNTFAFQVFNVFLFVPTHWISTLLMVNRLWDAVTDPLFGWLSDNTRSRWGRRRPYILIGGLLTGLSMPFLYAVDQGWSNVHYITYMAISSAIYIMFTSSFIMAWTGIGMEMTPDYNERTKLMAVRNAIQKMPELAMFFAAQFTTLAAWDGANLGNVVERVTLLFTSTDAWGKGEEPNILLGAQVYSVILGSIIAVSAIAMFFLLKERYYKNIVARKQEKLPIVDTIFKAIACKPFRSLLVMVLAYGLGTSMVGILGYYNTLYYVCQGDLALGAAWNFKMGIAGMVFGFCGIPFYTMISKWFGKRHAMTLVLIMAIGAFIGDWWFYNPNYPWMQLLACGCVAFTGAGFWTIYHSLLTDVIDYDELETGKRREGSFSACQSWISKVGMALGAGASGYILTFTGFDAELKGAQTAETILWIRIMLSSVPVVFLIGAVIAIIKFPLSKEKMHELRDNLEAMRGKV
ncbi:MAG: MFS transporter [Opitutales bacterium]|nr:MFS transporter [Opitutales bacterium]